MSAGDEASNKIENWRSSSFLDSTFWWKVEAVIESTELNSDGETKWLKRSTMQDRCGFWASPCKAVSTKGGNIGSRGMMGN